MLSDNVEKLIKIYESNQTCFACKCAINEQQYIFCLNNYYHISCFNCMKCKEHLDNSFKIYMMNNTIICNKCYLHSIKRCAKCAKPILDESIITVDQNYFHKDCFKCMMCETHITDKFAEKDGKYFCIKDFDKELGYKCEICKSNILPNIDSGEVVYLKFESKRFHPKCFRCEFCKQILKKQHNKSVEYFEMNGDKCCEQCFVDLKCNEKDLTKMGESGQQDDSASVAKSQKSKDDHKIRLEMKIGKQLPGTAINSKINLKKINLFELVEKRPF